MSLLGLNKLFEVRNLEFIKSEKYKVGEDRIKDHIVTIEGWAVERVEDSVEDFEEFFVTDATVEHLFDKNFLVRIFHLQQRSPWDKALEHLQSRGRRRLESRSF